MVLIKFKYVKNNPSEEYMINDISKVLREAAKTRSWPEDWEQKCNIKCNQQDNEYQVEVTYE